MAVINPGFENNVHDGAGMLVFVPEMLQNVGEFARQIYSLATDQHRWVLYLTLNGRGSNGLADSRQLATLAALTDADSVHASALQIESGDVPGSLRALTHPGDLVIWPDTSALVPASLEKALGITQIVLPEAHGSTAAQHARWHRSLLFWMSGLATLAGFFYLESRLDDLVSGAPLIAALVFMAVVEIAILYQCDRVFR